MSVQYTDGSFSENMPFSDALQEFQRSIDIGTGRALYVGSELELNAIKEKDKLATNLQKLEERLTKLEEGPIKSDRIIIPTRDELIKALRK